jgi:hypothetical protein
VRVYPDREAFVAAHDMGAFAASTGWARSSWDDLKIVHAGPDKVHIAVVFTRYDNAGEVIAAYESLYVVERSGERWAVRARSSFAP